MSMQSWKAPREPHHVPPPPPHHHMPSHHGAPIPPHLAIMEGLEFVSQQLAELSQRLTDLQAIAGVNDATAGDTVSE